MFQLNNELSYKIIGLMYEIHNKLGHLHPEKHYQRALAILLTENQVKYEQEKPVNIKFNENIIGKYQVDFLIENQIILETKTIDINLNKYHFQILSYMNQLQIPLGLLANFRTPKLQLEHLILPEKYLKQTSA